MMLPAQMDHLLKTANLPGFVFRILISNPHARNGTHNMSQIAACASVYARQTLKN